jgi:DNA-binding Lrp family transcriptional regulator
MSLSHPSVLERIRQMENRGILHGFWLQIDPSIFNSEDLLVWFEWELTHDDATKVLHVEDVAWVALKVDGDLTVQLWPMTRSKRIERSSYCSWEETCRAIFLAKSREPQRMSTID